MADTPTDLAWNDYRALVEQVEDYAMFVLDLDGHVASWNRGAQKIKGYAAHEIVGQHFSKFYPEEDIASRKPQRELEQVLLTGHIEDEGWRIRADGSRFWAFVSITLLRDAYGAPRGFGKVTRDLTARKLAEDTARQRDSFRVLSQQLDDILEGVVDGISVQDRRGKLVFVNSAAVRLTGLSSREEMLTIDGGELFRRFEMRDEHGQPFPPENLPGRRVLAGERSASALIHTRDRETGDEWWAQIRSSAVLGDDGSPELAVNIWHDVSQERRREEHERYLNEATAALSRSLDYQATLDTLANVLVPGLCDWCAIHLLEGSSLKAAVVTHVDPEKRRQAEAYQLQYPPRPDETAGIWEVIRRGEPILHSSVPEAALRQSACDAEQLRFLKAAELRSLLLVPIKARDKVLGTLSLIAAESGRRYDRQDVSLATELGRRVGTFIENALLYEHAQAAAASAEAAARQADMAGRLKDEFLATVSHELRTPLNAIVGWSSVLKVRAEPALVAKGIAVINRNAATQSKIIEDILDVSRIITGKLRLELRPVDLVGIVLDAIEVVRPSAAARDISLDFQRPAEPALLVGDAERLQQVMWNLLSNAVKFSERGGRVQVRLEQRGSQVVARVVDQGKGIDLAFLPYVFERFKQADSSTTRRFGGLGLGLAIVRHIVELHGGRVAATSAGPGRGAAFEISLPVQAVMPLVEEAATRATSARPASEPPAASLEGLRVLVVDDEADARDLLELVLTQAGAKV
ncbi:MAG TPA: PAS domain S-box protein, partial [Polyangiaceae bacterium]|nr:PAS domain S-box protein [Polyangiaceae bacterium]